jgi:flavin-dependent dehydrogenase
MLAAETIYSCYENNIPLNKENLDSYMNKCYQAFGKDLRFSSMLAGTFFTVPSLMYRFLTDNNEIITKLLDILEGRYTYRKLVKEIMLKLPGYWVKKTCQIRA